LLELFIASFIAATLLPGGSEAILLWMLHQGEHSASTLVLSATLGNTLGGIVTYGMGVMLAKCWSPESLSKHQNRAIVWVQKYGHWSLLLSWVPFIGDPLCFVAGCLGLNWFKAGLAILVGKSLRYITIATLASAFFVTS